MAFKTLLLTIKKVNKSDSFIVTAFITIIWVYINIVMMKTIAYKLKSSAG